MDLFSSCELLSVVLLVILASINQHYHDYDVIIMTSAAAKSKQATWTARNSDSDVDG